LALLACGASPGSPGLAGASTDAGTATEAGLPQAHPPLQQGPAHPVGGFSVDLGDPSIPNLVGAAPTDPIQVPPGGELFPCVVFPLVLQGTSHIVAAGQLTSSPGLHHGNITMRPSDGMAGIHACANTSWTTDVIGSEAFDVLAGGQVLFGSTTQIKSNEWESFPPGMGFAIKDGQQIIAHMHYLNPTSQQLTPVPKYQWYTIDPATLSQQLYPFAWELKNFSVPPHTKQTFTGQCATSQPMNIVNVLPHMHQLGAGLDLGYLGGKMAGQPFLSSPGYAPDSTLQVQYTPAVDLSQGTGFSMACTWDNTTGQTIVEGTGINEMCMVFGYAWPKSGAYSAVISPGDTSSCFATIAP
ncbi:MAG: hypothetical protein ACHQNA_14430, partial [Acidimicrobiales bacterium]